MYLIILIMLFITIIYNLSGIYLLVPFFLAIINFIVTTLNLYLNPKNDSSRYIQTISLVFIIFILILNVYYLILYI